MLRKLRKFLLCFTAVLLSGIAALAAFSHYVKGTSIMSTVTSLYISIVNPGKIFESREDTLDLMNEKKLSNLTKVVMPEMTLPSGSHQIGQMQYFTVGESLISDTVIFYFPGGAFINQPTDSHWSFIDRLSTATQIPVVVPVYLKATNFTCDEAYSEAIELYSQYAGNISIKHIILMGDSSGGNFALSLAMQLRSTELLQPEKIILSSPWLDLSMKNEKMQALDETDHILSVEGLRAIGEVWAGERGVFDPVASPLFGSFVGLGEIIIFTGTNDILYPDILLLEKRIETDGASCSLYVEENLCHAYTLLRTPEAEKAFEVMKNEIML